MKLYINGLLCLLCVAASAMWGITAYRLNHERAVFKEYYDTRPTVELIKEPESGSILLRVDGRFYYIFQHVCTPTKKT